MHRNTTVNSQNNSRNSKLRVQGNSFCRIKDGIFIRQNEFHRKFRFLDILWLEASGNYCYIHLSNRTRIIVVEQLSHIEPQLPTDMFIRIHRSWIVNINSIDGFVGNQLCIGDIRLNISAPYRQQTMQCLPILGSKQWTCTR